MVKILVVGASGPIGRAAANELKTLGHSIKRVSRSGGACSDQVDVTNSHQVARLLNSEKPEVVVYLARPELGDPDSSTERIVSSANALQEFARRCETEGVRRLIFASSAALYGTDNEFPRHEFDEVHAPSAYAESKLRSERILKEFGATSSVSVLILRIFNVYGHGLSHSLVNRLAAQDSRLIVHNSESFVRDYIHVSDVARAIGFAVSDTESNVTVINVGTGIGTSNRALLTLFPDANYTVSPVDDVRSFSVADISLMRESWGFEPKVSLEIAARKPKQFLL